MRGERALTVYFTVFALRARYTIPAGVCRGASAMATYRRNWSLPRSQNQTDAPLKIFTSFLRRCCSSYFSMCAICSYASSYYVQVPFYGISISRSVTSSWLYNFSIASRLGQIHTICATSSASRGGSVMWWVVHYPLSMTAHFSSCLNPLMAVKMVSSYLWYCIMAST